MEPTNTGPSADEIQAELRRLERNVAAAKHWRALGCPPGEILPPDDPKVS